MGGRPTALSTVPLLVLFFKIFSSRMNVWKKTTREEKIIEPKSKSEDEDEKNPKRWHIKTFWHITKKNFNEPLFPHLNRWCFNQSFHSSVPLFSTFTLLRIFQLTYLQAGCQKEMRNMENVTYGTELKYQSEADDEDEQKSKQVNKITQIWKRGWPKFEV